ncbi:hypothetical protein SUGI_0350320 [Cryptomeria japonica]|nr:hypothetical protein SUGI_0350320 [Cryptomeria japonica]
MAKFLDCIDLVSSFITANCLEGIASLCTTKGPELSLKQDELKALSQVKDTESIDILIGAIHLMLEKETAQKKNQDKTSTSSESTSMTEKLDEWTPLFETGATILTFVNDYMQEIDLFQSDGEVFKVVSEILKQIGQIHPVVAGLSMGSMLCASQLYSKNLFRFLKTSLDEQSLKDLREKIDRLYQGLLLRAVIANAKLQRGRIDIMQPEYPSEADIYQ